MTKHIHEIRDPVHVFIRLDSDERKVLDSRPFQRLRHIHQLALTSLVYPGATHRRFEHSLGVMDLADRVFKVVTDEAHRDSRVRDIYPGADELAYWRRALRMAALCHDIGHLPFSHAAEKDLLPEGQSHETLTVRLIFSTEMKRIWDKMRPPLRPEDIAKLAVGPSEIAKALKAVPDELATEIETETLTSWEAILSEIIIGDAFGVDRMDYLLRDSLHAGVAYGRFDHHRLIDTLRIIPGSNSDSAEPALGIEWGGLESAEALLLARYFMYSQVYFHPVRRAYDIHLRDFLVAWLGEHGVPAEMDEYLDLTDNEVLAELRKAARDSEHPGYEPARRIMQREHFRVLYERNPEDIARNPEAATVLHRAARDRFGEQHVRLDSYRQKGKGNDFPVRARDDRIVSISGGINRSQPCAACLDRLHLPVHRGRA